LLEIGDERIADYIGAAGTSAARTLDTAPTESSASMTGVFAMVATSPSNIEAMAGDMDMNANFASGTVSGNLTNLVEIPDLDNAAITTSIVGSVTYDGTLNVAAGNQDDISADGNGSYVGSDGVTYTVDLDLSGDVLRRPNGDLGAIGAMTANANGGGASIDAEGAYFVAE